MKLHYDGNFSLVSILRACIMLFVFYILHSNVLYQSINVNYIRILKTFPTVY